MLSKNLFILIFVSLFLISFVSAECVDPDGGINYYTADSDDGCLVQNGAFITLEEHWCDGDQERFDIFQCPYGCALDVDRSVLGNCNGDGTVLTCVDSDGNDYSTKGNVTAGEFIKEDFCGIVDNMLFEWTCDNNNFSFEARYCDEGYDCENGACVVCEGDACPKCTDSDGGNDMYVKGEVISRAGDEQVWDFCKTDSVLTELTCDEQGGKAYEIDCPLGCEDGACNSAPRECDSQGIIVNYKYCDLYGYFRDLKSDGKACANDYECRNQSCVSEICQSKYVDVRLDLSQLGAGSSVDDANPDNSILDNFFYFIWDQDCSPADQTYFCEGGEAFLCGVNGVWESKGNIPGVCFYEKPFVAPSASSSSGRSSGRSSGSSSSSTSTQTTTTTEVIPAESTALLIGLVGQTKTFILSGSSEVHTITFIRIGTDSVTFLIQSEPIEVTLNIAESKNIDLDGDGVDDVKTLLFFIDPVTGAEIQITNLDTIKQIPLADRVLIDEFDGNVCGDGKCGTIESSYTCRNDCIPGERGVIAYYSFLVIVSAVTVLVVFLLYKRVIKKALA